MFVFNPVLADPPVSIYNPTLVVIMLFNTFDNGIEFIHKFEANVVVTDPFKDVNKFCPM